MSSKRVYFVRHGEAAGNKGGFSQTTTTPLTEIGQEQAVTVADRFAALPIDAVLASHYDRAQQTATPIAAITGQMLETTDFFHELKKPTSVEGSSHDSVEYQSYIEIEREQYTNPEWRYEDGETFDDVLTRVTQGVKMLEERSEKNIVLVSHGRLLRFIVSFLLHKKMLTAEVEQLTATSMKAVNTGITVFEYSNEEWKLLTFNDIAHFAE